jgi:hypothetical protein
VALIEGTIPTLVNGVSQQPDTLRQPSQGALQENCLSSPVYGLLRRPPTTHLAAPFGLEWGDGVFHLINRDAQHRYIACFRSGQCAVLSLTTGEMVSVAAPSGVEYLTGSGAPGDYLRFVTIADYTFVVNTQRTVGMLPAPPMGIVNDALVFIKLGNYGKTYKIHVNGAEVATYTTPTGKVDTDVQALDVSFIGAQLAGQISAKLPSWGVSQTGNVIRIVAPNDAAFTIFSEDGYGDQAMTVIRHEVQRFSDLPSRAPSGFRAKVVGSPESGTDDYWVEFQQSNGGDSVGVWRECAAPGTPVQLDPLTMPHVLVREANGSFTFRPSEWGQRKAGDEEMIPRPSFVGRAIRDVFSHKSRLGLLSDENVVLSEAGTYFNFWRNSAAQLIDTDPIDVASSSNTVALLDHAVSFNETLLVFSRDVIFRMATPDLLTPQTAALAESANYPCAPGCRPVGLGQFVWFAADTSAGTARVRALGAAENSDQLVADDVTSHVPDYIAAGVRSVAASANDQMLFLRTEGDPEALYVYRFLDAGNGERLLSSWSRWSYSGNVLAALAVDDLLFTVVQTATNLTVEMSRIAAYPAEDGVRLARLDRSVVGRPSAYDPENDHTPFLLPYQVSEDRAAQLVVVSLEDRRTVPARLNSDGTALVVPGNWDGKLLQAGFRYESRYRFSKLWPRPQGSAAAMDTGRLQIRFLEVLLDETEYCRAEVFLDPRQPASLVPYSAAFLDSPDNIFGHRQRNRGRLHVPIMGNTERLTVDLVNDSPWESRWISARWEALWRTRGRRI